MKLLLLLTILVFVEAGDENNADKLKKRMKLIGGMQNYGKQNTASKADLTSESDIIYKEPMLNNNYTADTKFNPLGMGHLYYVTRMFLDLLEGENKYPDDLKYGNFTIQNVIKNGPAWLELYSEITAVVAAGLFFAILMPIIGLLFCCCRCGGRCGARTKQEKLRDPCKRVMTATALSAVAVIILFGVVCAFVTNEHLNDGTKKLKTNVKAALNDTNIYFTNTKTQINYLLKVNFDQLNEKLDKSFINAGDVIKNQLASASRAVALVNLTAIVNGMEIIKQDLAGIQEMTRKLQNSTLSLNDDLDVLRHELITQLRSCINEPACRDLLQQRRITELRVAQNFSELVDRYFPKLPDITRTFASISNLLGDNNSIDSIQRKVLDGQKNFDNIKHQISQSVRKFIPEIKEAMEKIGHRLEECNKAFQTSLSEVQYSINNFAVKNLESADNYIREYGCYRYYLGLGVSGALLLILLCLTLGLLCGICGKKPEEMYTEDADCCNTIAGGRFLMLAVWLSFLLSSVLMIVTIVHFLVGVTLDMGVCKPLNDPTNNTVFELIDRYVDLRNIYGKKDVNIKLSEIIGLCHQKKSIYETLKLNNLYDIDELKNEISVHNIEDQIRKFKNQINVRTDDVVLLAPDAKEKLITLAQSPLNDIQFYKYAELLNLQVTKINLTQLSNELQMNADKLPTYSSGGYDLSNIKKFLRTKARYLKFLQTSLVVEIQNEINILRSNVSNLKEHLKFNQTSLRDAILILLNEIQSAQLYLKKNGSAEMKLLIDDYGNEIKQLMNNYVERVINKTKHDMGKCEPMSNVYSAVKVAGCNRILDPFNGFWASVGWSVLLFIPAIILSVKLSSLYTKSEAYGPAGIYGENEYLYDAYADRDNMPLAMAQRAGKKKNRHRNYRESYDNSGNGSYLQDYNVHLSRADRASAETDIRYNDVAPKHWGDMNSRGNGPPRYHHPPSTEYERPPPYYFPGPGERT